MMRTSSGLVACSPQFYGTSGPVDSGSDKPLAASASPGYVSGARAGVNQPVFTRQTTVTVSGGKKPYSFAWSTVVDWTVTAPTSATTSFSSGVSPGTDATATFTCTVTDARGDTVTASVNAAVFNYGGGSGGVIP